MTANRGMKQIRVYRAVASGKSILVLVYMTGIALSLFGNILIYNGRKSTKSDSLQKARLYRYQ